MTERGQCHADAPQVLARVARDAQVIVAVPAAAVLLTTVAVNLRNRRKLQQALPYLLEDQLLREVEAYHFAIGPVRQGRLSVAVVARERMDAWMDWLRAADLQAAHLLPETLLLPFQEDRWTLLIQPQMTWVRTGECSGFACDTDNLELMLTRAAAAARPVRIACHLAPTLDQAVVLARLHSALPDLEIEVRVTPDVDLLLAQSLEALPALDLGQQSYALGGGWQQAQRWRWPAILAGVWLTLLTGRQIYDQTLLGREDALLQAKALQLYRSAFPQDQRIIDPRAQMQQHLHELQARQGQEGFLKLLGEAAPVLAAMPGFQLRGLQYHEGVLEIDLQTTSIQALEQAKTRLAASPVMLEVVSVAAQGPLIQGRVHVRSRV